MKEISINELMKARDKCAVIISRHGKRYLPIFERLEKEIAAREKQEHLYQKALKISTQNLTQIDTPICTQNDYHSLKR